MTEELARQLAKLVYRYPWGGGTPEPYKPMDRYVVEAMRLCCNGLKVDANEILPSGMPKHPKLKALYDLALVLLDDNSSESQIEVANAEYKRHVS